jgi:hypothetical protein
MKKSLIIFGLLALWPCSLLAQEIRVGAGVADEDIYVGDSFQYQIIIEGHRKRAEVDLSSLQAWSPKYFSSESRTILNGRRNRKVEKKYVMAYTLVAQDVGPVTLPSVSVRIDGRMYSTNSVPINIVQPGETDSIQLEMVVSPTKCFVGQPVTLTIHWYLDRDVGDYFFNIPALNMPDVFAVEAMRPVKKPGHTLVEVMVDSDKSVASQHAATYQNRKYTAITVHKLLIPKRVGSFVLERPSISCDLEVGRSNRNRNGFGSFFQDRRQYRRFQATGEPVNLEVKPLPQQGRPESFTGLVGRYAIEAQASPTEVNVGDPITLTISIRGDLLKSVAMPDLKAIDGFAKNFKIPKEQSRPTIKNKSKHFVQTIRASNDQVAAIPSIPLSFFDVGRGEYVTATSWAIALAVTPTTIVSADQAVGDDMTVRQLELEAVKQGVAANYEGPEIFRDQSFSVLASMREPVYLALYLGPLLLVVGVWVVRWVVSDDPLRQHARRRDQSLKKAQSRLRQIQWGKAGALEETGDMLRAFISDLTDRKSESLTTEDCRLLLRQNQCGTDVIERFCQLLEVCDHSRYGGGEALLEPLDDQKIIELLKSIYHDKQSKRVG